MKGSLWDRIADAITRVAAVHEADDQEIEEMKSMGR